MRTLFRWAEGGRGMRETEGEASVAVLEAHGFGKDPGEVGGGEHLPAGPGGEGASAAEQQGMGESRGDFLDVVGDEDEAGSGRVAGEGVDEGEEAFAGDRVEAGAGFVEDEEAR